MREELFLVNVESLLAATTSNFTRTWMSVFLSYIRRDLDVQDDVTASEHWRRGSMDSAL